MRKEKTSDNCQLESRLALKKHHQEKSLHDNSDEVRQRQDESVTSQSIDKINNTA